MATPKAPADHFTVLYFAAAASYTGRQHDFLSAPLPVGKLYDVLDAKYPGMKEKVLVSCALTVNLEYVDLDEEASTDDGAIEVKEGDEVGIIPPVSSG